jgi:tetratricopeptide (TPR) repeat protein
MEWKYTYAKAIPIEAQYLFRKAMEVYSTGNAERALKYLQQTLVIAPHYSRALFEMGNCLTQLGQHEDAQARYEQAIRIEPALKELLINRA